MCAPMQVYDFAWPQRGVPDMEKLVDLCRSMDAWLRADKQNVLVVHCHVSVMILYHITYIYFNGFYIRTSPNLEHV